MENIPHADVSRSKSLLGRYFQFLRSPTLTQESEPIPAQKAIIRILRLYSLHLLIILGAGVFISRIAGAQESNKLLQLVADIPAWYLIAMAVVFAPLVEESMFRLPLRNFSRNLVLSGSLLLWLGLGTVPGVPQAFIAGCSLAIISLNLYVWIKHSQRKLFQPFYTQYPRLVFYSAALLFGVVHITNYDSQIWPLLPLLVFPQLVLSLWLGFVRLRYGFWWSVFAHAFHNGCVLLPIGIVKVFGSAQLQSQNLDPTTLDQLPPLDLFLIGGVSLYTLGGLAFCGVSAWKVVREWTRQR